MVLNLQQSLLLTYMPNVTNLGEPCLPWLRGESRASTAGETDRRKPTGEGLEARVTWGLEASGMPWKYKQRHGPP